MRANFYSRKKYDKKSTLLLVFMGVLIGLSCIPLNTSSALAPPPEVWNRSYSYDSVSVYGYDIAAAGNYLYIVGRIYTSDNAAFIQKYDLDGNLIWTRVWNATGDDGFRAVTAHNSKIYAVGTSHNASKTNQINTLIVCYDADGNQEWNRTWSSEPTMDSVGDGLWDIAIYNTSIYVVGYSDNSTSSAVMLVMKCNSTGHPIWTQWWGSTSQNNWGYGIGLYGANAIYVVGDDDSLFATSSRDVIINKYNSSGHLLWSERWGGYEYDSVRGMVIDDDQNIYATGSTNSFGLATSEIFLVKFDASGQRLWNITFGEGFWSQGNSLAIDPNGRIYITGFIEEVPIMSPPTDLLIAQCDSSGNKLWSARWGNLQSNTEEGYGIVAPTADSLFVVGSGPGAGGYGDAFLIKFDIGEEAGWILFLIILFPLVGLGIAIFVVYKRRAELFD